MITRKTTIDQHRGTHPVTGMRITALHDVVTEYALAADAPEEHAWVDAVHEARVRLESLDADQRQRAYDWLAANDHDTMDASVAYRRAVAAAITSPESINALLASTDLPTPLTWMPCPERGAGWWRTELTTASAAARAYEVGHLLVAADNSLQYEIIQGRRGTPQALLVGPR